MFIKWEWKLFLPLQCKSNEIKKACLTKDFSSLDCIYKMYLRIFWLIAIGSHHHHRLRRHHHHHHYHQHHTLDLNTTKRLKQVLVASRKLTDLFTKVYWFLSWNRVYDDSNTQDIMEIPVNNGTSIVASLKEQLEPKDNISGVCTDQPAYDNDVSVSEEEFY